MDVDTPSGANAAAAAGAANNGPASASANGAPPSAPVPAAGTPGRSRPRSSALLHVQVPSQAATRNM